MKKILTKLFSILTFLILTDISHSYFIKGYIKDSNQAGISSVTVSLTGAATAGYLTGDDGYYEFLDLDAGNYTVTPDKPGMNFSPVDYSYQPLNSNRDNQDFTAVLETYYIKGYLRDIIQLNGIEGVTVTLSGDSTGTYTTGGIGYYEFLDLTPGNYIVTPYKDNWSFSPGRKDYLQLDANQDSQNFFGSRCYDIKGYIRNSAGAGIDGVKLTLSVGKEDVYITDSSGYYEFLDLFMGSYEITPSKDNWTFSPMGRYYPLLTKDFNNEDFIGVLEKIDERNNFFKPINNLFNPDNNEQTAIWYNLPEPGQVTIRIYTLDGILVYTLTNEYHEKGIYTEQWNGKNSAGEVVAQGTYLVHIEAPGFRDTKKIIVIR